MQRTLVILTFLILAMPSLVASHTAAEAASDDRGTLDVALDLFREARAARDTTQERRATAYLDEHILHTSLVDTTATRAAWEESLRSSEPAAPYVAEAVLWELVGQNVDAALAAGDNGSLDVWMTLAFERTDRDGWSIPPWTAQRAAAPPVQNVTKDLLSVMASRARETLVTALLLHHAGLADEAVAALDGASALLSVFQHEATTRLPSALVAPFLENATRGAALIADIPSERKNDTWPGLLAPLVALEFDRDIEQIDVFAMRNVDAASSIVRAAQETPQLRPVLAEQAWLQYGADRAGLFLRGDGTMNATDDAHDALRALGPDASDTTLRAAAHDVRDALTQVGLLVRGIVLKVEIGGVQPDRVHHYQVTIVRPPLDGVARFHVRLSYDPSVIEVLGAEPFGPHDHAGHDHDEPTPRWDVATRPGETTLDVRLETPLRRSAHVVTLLLEARGEQGSVTPLTVEEAWFEEPDGDRAGLWKLRHGQATVTVMPPEELARETPAVAPLLVALVIIGLARRPRRT